MKVEAKHGKVTQNMHGANINYRYVWDVSALPSFLGVFEGFQDADFLYNFSRIFGALLMAGKPEIQKHQNTTTSSWVH